MISSMEPTICNKKLDLAALYFDEIPEEIGSEFNNHLEEVKLLILAERILPPKKRNFELKYVTQRFQSIQEFVSSKCEETKANIDIDTNTSIIDSIPHNQFSDTEFEISETQLLRACEEAENNEFQNNNSLLHAFLDDFGSVESSPCIIKTDNSIDDTIQTFSDPNISNNTETVANDLESLYDSDSILSDDSENYRQIEFTPKVNPVRDKINILNSVAIRENISNLSKHFSQQLNKNTHSDNTSFKEDDSQYFPKSDDLAHDQYQRSDDPNAAENHNVHTKKSLVLTNLNRLTEYSPSSNKKIDSTSDTTVYQFQENNSFSENNKATNSNLSQNNQNKKEPNANDLESLYDSDSILSDDSDTYRQIELTPHNIVRNKMQILNSAAIRENISRLSKHFSQQLDKHTDLDNTLAETKNKVNVCTGRSNSNDTFDSEESTSTMRPSKQNGKENFEFILNRNVTDEDFFGFEDFEVYIFRNIDTFKDSRIKSSIISQVQLDSILSDILSPSRREPFQFKLIRNASDEDFHGFEDSEVYIFRRNHKFKDTNNTFTESSQIKPAIITHGNLDSILSNGNKVLEEYNNLNIEKTGSLVDDNVKCDLKQDGIESLPFSLNEKMLPTTSPLPKDKSSFQSLLYDCHDWDDTDFDHVCAVGEGEEPSKTNELFNVNDVDWNEEFLYKSQSSSQNMKKLIVLKDSDIHKTAYNNAAISSKMAKIKAEALLKQFTLNTNETILEIPKENGFKTASNKTMPISESARLKAKQFIQDFNNSQTMSCKNLKPNVPALPSSENEKNTELKISEFENNVGASFTTASKKPISISEEAIKIANRLVIEVDADSSSLETSKTDIRKRKRIENEPLHTNLEKISKLNSLSGLKTNTSPRTPLSSIVNSSLPKNNMTIFKRDSTPLPQKQFVDKKPSVSSRRNVSSHFKTSNRPPTFTEGALTPSYQSFNENFKFASSFSIVDPDNINSHSFAIVQDLKDLRKTAIDYSSEIRYRDEDKNIKKYQQSDSVITISNPSCIKHSNQF